MVSEALSCGGEGGVLVYLYRSQEARVRVDDGRDRPLGRGRRKILGDTWVSKGGTPPPPARGE